MFILPGADVRTITDVLVCQLPPSERIEFIEWSRGVKADTYWEGLQAFFTDQEATDGIAEYVVGQIDYLEKFLGIRIDALITVGKKRIAFRNLYDELS